jgi:hypothetical protein
MKDSQDCAAEVFSAKINNSPQTGGWEPVNGMFEALHVPEHPPWTLAEKLRLACDPCFLFARIVGSQPNEWQRTLLESIEASANDVTLPNRSWQ